MGRNSNWKAIVSYGKVNAYKRVELGLKTGFNNPFEKKEKTSVHIQMDNIVAQPIS